MKPNKPATAYVRAPATPLYRRIKPRWVLRAIAVIALLVLLHLGRGATSPVRGLLLASAPATSNAIHSGSGGCLDIYHDGSLSGTPIQTASCNGSTAQNWVTTATAIQQKDTNSCVAADTNGKLVLGTCSSAPNQVWLREQQGYYNPATDKCISTAAAGAQISLASCNSLSSDAESWTPDTAAQAPACGNVQGARQKIVCETVKQWGAWQAANSNHEALLNIYTDGTPQEEWCADFVSYIYQQVGYPFTNGSADGWDEDVANTVQYMNIQGLGGFTLHMANSGYVPKPGDLAFFDYPGGHIEVVVSGGKKPTFVYGDSAQIDPTTGNGQMKANTKLADGSLGTIYYYLTPNGA